MRGYYPGDRLVQLEHRFRKYGLTLADYGRMRDRQHNKCAICKRHADHAWHLVVDHDHVTGKVRDLLCSACNKSIGMMRDDAARLRAAAGYLERHGSKPKGFDGATVPDATDLRGGKCCTSCGYSRKPDKLRAGLCQRCRRNKRREFNATAERIDYRDLEKEGGSHSYTDDDFNWVQYEAPHLDYGDEHVRFEEIDGWGDDRYYRQALDVPHDDGPDSLDLAESGELKVEHNSWYKVPPCMCDTCDDCLERQRNAKFPWVPRLPDGRMLR